MVLGKDDLELVRIVGEDLSHISDEVAGSHSNAAIRRISPILRRLFNDNDAMKAWTSLGLEPRRPLIRAQRVVGSVPKEGTIWVGQATSGPLTIRNFSISFNTSSKGDYEIIDAEMPLHEFLESAAVVHNGTKIKQWQLIAYIANKRGGAHLDARRKKDDTAFGLLDALEGHQFGPSGLPSASHQLLGTAQQIMQSPDIQKLTNACLRAARHDQAQWAFKGGECP